ncbi:hypothetical protein SBOR_2418 [Sclerotinia borealis F-4128]|uniref:Uncharacterized protein n=1 Tax=Sclerotinia borealis (strain F-4128) TaxID=1432307 RepID=W9CK31_SCLBF|nr:hypothetical protein SBOR_2418 [Sclerotinia borealis F-4128]
MAATASAHSNLVTLHTHLHTLLIKLSLSLHLSSPSPSPFPPPPHNPHPHQRHSQHLRAPTSHSHSHSHRLSTINNPSTSTSTYTYKNNPNDPLEVLYTLSPPAFHYLPRSTLLPPQIVLQGFMETSENDPPLLEGRRMQIMVIPRGVRRIVVHFLVYDPVRRGVGGGAVDGLGELGYGNGNGKAKGKGKGKLRKKDSINALRRGNSKIRDHTTDHRSTSRLSNTSPNPNTNANANSDMNLNSNDDGMEIEVMGKAAASVSRMQEEREEDELGEYVVMKRVVTLPRRVWCGRNCKDKFEQLFIRRT